MKITLLGIALAAVALCAGPRAWGQASPRAAQGGASSGPAPQQLDAGRYEGGKYVNDFFGLTFTPPDWVRASAEQNAALTEAVKSAVASDDKRKQAVLEESVERSRVLLSMTKLPQGQPANAALMVVAERVPSPAVKTGADVFRLMENGFKNTPFQIEFEKPVHDVPLGGAEFAGATVKVTSPYGVYRQKIYVTLRKGYSLQFFFTYLDEGDLPPFDAAMKTVVIK